ncbi:MAG: GGDEF domain-containing protein, partial [Anaerolineales bacterium]|nr:GGDEF domain-containing protein [Anaerolineales bacterium]
PVFRGDQIVAILGVGNKSSDYDQTDVAMVERLADLAWDTVGRKRAEDALRLANTQLETRLAEIEALQGQLREQAIRDPLTGLYNRRYMQETFEMALAHAERLNEPIGVLLMDVDHFKAFNDVHGHKAGDLVLEALGRLLRATTRQMDIACRYGGEEFVLLMPGATLDMAARRAEMWRGAFAAEPLSYAGRGLQATLSVGVAAYPVHGRSVDELLKAADVALYQAKSAGRNCVRAPAA